MKMKQKQEQKQQLPTETADRQKAAMPMRSGKRSREVSLKEMEASLEEMKGKIATMEEWKERTGKENRQVKRKLRQLQKKLERYEGRRSKKRKHCEEMEDFSSRILQLQFTIQPSRRIFTKTKVKGEKSVAIQFVLVDRLTGQVVSSGPESSMEVELVLVNGDFTGSETGNWTWKYFKENIIPGRRGKQPILIGEVVLKLNKGVAAVHNLKIADNSSWVPSKSFRLAARVTDGYFHGIRVKEAITNPIVVIECRLKSSEKHYPPHPKDPLWRLEKISKSGAVYQRLTGGGIHTVEDFLKSLNDSEDGLRNIVKMATDRWEVTVEHAKTCVLSDERIKRPISNQQVNPVDDVAPPEKILKMPLSKWEVTVKHAKTCIPSGEMAPFCNQQIKPGRETSQPIEAVKQHFVRTVDEQREVVGVSSNDSIRIQNDGLSNHQQFGGSSLPQHHITSQHWPECLHVAVNGTSTSGYTSKHFGLGASTCLGEKSPAVDMISFHNISQENDGYGFQPKYCASPEPELSWDVDDLLSLPECPSDPDGSAYCCFSMPSESTAAEHKGNLKWYGLIMAMVFTKRIVPVKGMNVLNPHEA